MPDTTHLYPRIWCRHVYKIGLYLGAFAYAGLLARAILRLVCGYSVSCKVTLPRLLAIFILMRANMPTSRYCLYFVLADAVRECRSEVVLVEGFAAARWRSIMAAVGDVRHDYALCRALGIVIVYRDAATLPLLINSVRHELSLTLPPYLLLGVGSSRHAARERLFIWWEDGILPRRRHACDGRLISFWWWWGIVADYLCFSSLSLYLRSPRGYSIARPAAWYATKEIEVDADCRCLSFSLCMRGTQASNFDDILQEDASAAAAPTLPQLPARTGSALFSVAGAWKMSKRLHFAYLIWLE